MPNLQLDNKHQSYTYSLEAPISLMKWHPSGEYLAVVANRKLHKWDHLDGVIIRQQTLRGEENTVDLNSSLSHAVAIYRDNQISVQRLGPGFVPIPWQKYHEKFEKLAWAPNKSHIAATITNELLVFALATRKTIPLARRMQTDTPIQAICWSHDSTHVIACTQAREVHIANVKTRSIVAVFKHTTQILQVAVTPDNKNLVIAGRDGTISFYNLEKIDQQQIPTMNLPSVGSRIKAIDFSPDNSLMAARLANEYVYVWSLATQRLVDIIHTRCNRSNGIAFHPTERKLAISIFNEGINTFAIYQIPKNIHELAPQVEIIKKRIAKIMIVGDRYVGKSSVFKHLIKDFDRIQENIAIIPYENAVGVPNGELGVRLEMWLWDTPNAPDSLLLSELELRNIAISLIVFDGTKNKYRQSLDHWLSRLTRIQNEFVPDSSAILVETNTDSGLSNVSDGQIIDTKFPYRDSFKINSQGEGASELLLEIFRAIDWRNVQEGVFTRQFENISNFLFQLSDIKDIFLISITQLFQQYLNTQVVETLRSEEAIFKEFESCINFLEMQGIIRRFRYGGLVLLIPNVLNIYISSLLDYISDSNEFGAIEIQDVLQLDFNIDETYQLESEYLEKALRLAIVDDLISNDIAYREGDVLHFPHLYRSPISRFTRAEQAADFEYDVNERVDIIYSQIVNRIRLLDGWEFNGFQKGGASMRTPEGEAFIISYQSSEYSGKLFISCESIMHTRTQCLLDLVMQKYISQLTFDAEVTRTRIFKCDKCGKHLSTEHSRALSRSDFELGRTHVECTICGHEIRIVDECNNNKIIEDLHDQFVEIETSIAEGREEHMKRILLENKHTLGMYDALFILDKADEYYVQHNFHTYLRNKYAVYAKIQQLPVQAEDIVNMRNYDERIVYFLGNRQLSESDTQEIIRLAEMIGTVNRKIILVLFGSVSRGEELYNHEYIELNIMFDEDQRGTLDKLARNLVTIL